MKCLALLAVLLALCCSAKVHDVSRTDLWLKSPPPAGGLKLRLRQSFMQNLATYLLPDIVKAVGKVTIPGINSTHFTLSPIKLQDFDIQSLDVTLPNGRVEIAINGLSLTLPKTTFNIRDKVLGLNISCNGYFYGSATGTNASITTGLSLNTTSEKLEFTNVSSAAAFGSLDVNFQFTTFMCEVGENIIELFIGSINEVIKNAIEQKLPSLLSSVIETKGNAILQKIPFSMASPPVISKNYISLTAMLLPIAPPVMLTEPEDVFGANRRISGVRNTSVPDRDIEVFIPAATLDDMLILLTGLGIFNKNVTLPWNTSLIRTFLPPAYAMCPACPLNVDLALQTPPKIEFGGDNMTLLLDNVDVGLNVINKTHGVMSLLQLSINVTLEIFNWTTHGVNGSTIKFDIGFPEPGDIAVISSSIGPIDLTLIKLLINIALHVAVPGFNADFKGITLPSFHGFYFKDVIIRPTSGLLTAELNMQFP